MGFKTLNDDNHTLLFDDKEQAEAWAEVLTANDVDGWTFRAAEHLDGFAIQSFDESGRFMGLL